MLTLLADEEICKGTIDNSRHTEYTESESKHRFIEIYEKYRLEQMIHPIKLELINSLASADYSIIQSKGYDRYLHKTNAIMGYTLKNVDTRELVYAKAIYKDGGITYEKAIAKPGERFIITRHEVDALGFLNGYGIGEDIDDNGNKEWSIVTSYRGCGYYKDPDRYIPGYIRQHGYGGDSIHSDKWKVPMYELDNQGIFKLKPEYRERFSWLDDERYCKKINLRNNYVNIEDQRLLKYGEILDEKDFTKNLSYYSMYDERYNLIIRGNVSEEQIDNLINKLKLFGKDPTVSHHCFNGVREVMFIE